MMRAAAACAPPLISFWSPLVLFRKHSSTKNEFSTKGLEYNSYPATEH